MQKYKITERVQSILEQMTIEEKIGQLRQIGPSMLGVFNNLSGVPCTANGWMLKQVLREEVGFEGVTISDANAIAEIAFYGTHFVPKILLYSKLHFAETQESWLLTFDLSMLELTLV